MDETQTSGQDAGSWLAARLGHAIDVFVDRNRYEPLAIQDPSQAYGVDEFGRVYVRGQSNPAAMTAKPAISPALIGIGLVAVVLLFAFESKKG